MFLYLTLPFLYSMETPTNDEKDQEFRTSILPSVVESGRQYSFAIKGPSNPLNAAIVDSAVDYLLEQQEKNRKQSDELMDAFLKHSKEQNKLKENQFETLKTVNIAACNIF